jgi:hypothetical protein
MIKVIFVFFFVLFSNSVVLSSWNTSDVNEFKAKQKTKNCSISDPEILWFEYVFIDNQLFKITYYVDGTIGVVPEERLPDD